VWKTGVLAAAATLVFALLVFNGGRWTASLFSQGNLPNSAFTVTKIIPHIAVGSYDNNATKYTTILQVVNPGGAAVTVRASFYNTDGAPSDLRYATSAPNVPTFDRGFVNDVSLAPNSTLLITAALPTTTPAVYKGNWGKIQATGTVVVSTVFEMRDPAADKLYARVGVAGSPVMSKFAIPRMRNVSAGLDVAFAIVNAGTAMANLTATLRDASGAYIATKPLALAPGAQSAQLLSQFFNVPESSFATLYSLVTFDGGPSAQLGAVAIAYEGLTQTTFPVEPLP
jgi:hypothetical protein